MKQNKTVIRLDGRKRNELRKVTIIPYYLKHPYGSALIKMGNTQVICTAVFEQGVPKFLKGSKKGWLTAEYGMLPASSSQRIARDSSKGRPSGRSLEIQRLIGRSLRSVIDLQALGENTIWIDCDVIQADGGTRTAAITGSFVALMLALHKLHKEQLIETMPVTQYIAAVSVGIIDGVALLDLCYEEDVAASVDMNIVMTNKKQFVEIQGSGEESTFSYGQLNEMIRLAQQGIKQLLSIQKSTLQKLLK